MENKNEKPEKFSFIPAPVVYPRMLSEDTAGFEKSSNDFLRIIRDVIDNIKNSYDALNLEEPFDDATWQSLCTNSSVINERYSRKVSKIGATIGADSGIINKDFLNKKNPNITQIERYLYNVPERLNRYNQFSKGELQPRDIINVDSEPAISPEALVIHLEYYRAYVNNEREEQILIMLNRFANEYDNLITGLNNIGYGPHINFLNGSFIHNIFTESEKHRLSVIPSSPAFLAKFSKPKITTPCEKIPVY